MSPQFEFYFPNFTDQASYFIILSAAVPGFLSYQFLYPVLIEYKLINLSKNIGLILFLVMTIVSYGVISRFGLKGACFQFALFYFLVFLIQIYLYKKVKSLKLRAI